MLKKFLNLFIFILLVTVNFYTISFSVPASPNPVEIEQPDGTKVKVRVKGDEFYNWVEDNNGYTVVRDSATRVWHYAQQKTDGSLEKSRLVVGKDWPQGRLIKNLQDLKRRNIGTQRKQDFEKHLKQTRQFNEKLKQEKIQKIQKSQITNDLSKAQQKLEEETEERTNFVLLVQFNDLTFKDKKPFNSYSTDAEIRQHFNDLFNKEGYNYDNSKGSYYDYFKEVSYGKLKYKSIVSPIITVDIAHAECGENKGSAGTYKVFELIRTALEQFFNDNNNSALIAQLKEAWKDSKDSSGNLIPQGFTVIHAGGDAAQDGYGSSSDNIWSHKSNLSKAYSKAQRTFQNIQFDTYHTETAGRGYMGNEGLLRIGSVCHETIHFLGMPDLYDTTNESEGIGNFCIMSGGSYNGEQASPAHPCAWIKYKLGWAKVKTANEGINYINNVEEYNDAIYRFDGKNFTDNKEYFLIENRQPIGFDIGLPGASNGKTGLLIYHIDDRIYDGDVYQSHDQSIRHGEHYMVAIEEADNTSSNWKNAHMPSNIGRGRSTDYYRGGPNATLTVFNDTDTNKPNARSYNNEYSEIDISGISASATTMSFYFIEYSFEKFINNLNDNGIKFLNLIMKYIPAKNRDELKNLNQQEQAKIAKYFYFTSTSAKHINNMALLYYTFIDSGTIYEIGKEYTGKISSEQANLIIDLNNILLQSEQAITSIGNISSENKSPLENETTHSTVSKRFTGVSAVINIQEYHKNYGTLIYSFDKMVTMNYPYNIIEMTKDTDTENYPNYYLLKGEKTLTFNDLSQVICYPNPAREGYIYFSRLPDNTDNFSVEIFTMTAKLVKKFSVNDIMMSIENSIKWDCKNENGEDVSPGVYLILIKNSGQKKVFKIAVIR